MSNTTNFTTYKYQAYLVLCLGLVEEALKDCESSDYDLVSTQLRDILEVFDVGNRKMKTLPYCGNIIPFPYPY